MTPSSRFLLPDTYKQRVVKQFDAREEYERGNSFHPALAKRLVDLALPKQGERVLDVASGTGLVAFEAAKYVGETGLVFGVDISSGMLKQVLHCQAVLSPVKAQCTVYMLHSSRFTL